MRHLLTVMTACVLLIGVALAVGAPPASPEKSPGPEADAPATAAEALFRYGDRLRAGDRDGAMSLLMPRRDESTTLLPDEMRRWAGASLDFVVLGGYVAGNVAVFPNVWTGNNAADAKVLVRRTGVWRVCYLPDYKVLAGYAWSAEETGAIRTALTWFYDNRARFDHEAADVRERQRRWSARAAGSLHSEVKTDPDWRRKQGLGEPQSQPSAK